MVLIAGAGPVGLTLAMALARAGIAVRIVDPAAARTDKSKALVLWPRTLELLEIQGCVAAFLEAGMRGAGAHMRASGKELLHVRFDIARSDFPYALLIPQSETERVLEAELAALGVRVERDGELLAFAQDARRAALRHADGREATLRATTWPAATARTAPCGTRSAASSPATTMRSDWVLGDVHLAGALPRDELTICWTGTACSRSSPSSAAASASSPTSALPTRRRRRPDARRPAGDPRRAAARRRACARPGLARRLPHQRAQGPRLPRRPRLPGRRRRAHPQPGRRPGHEHRHAGRLQPGLEARAGHAAAGAARAARQLFAGAQRGRRPGAAQRRPPDRDRHHPQPGAAGAAQPRRGHARPPARRSSSASSTS